MENRVVWFIFHSETILRLRLHEVFAPCSPWSALSEDWVSHRHLVNLMIIHEDKAEPAQKFQLDFFVPHPCIPLYLLIFHWYPPPRSIPSNLIETFDVCDGLEICRLIPLPDYGVRMLGGVHEMLEHVSHLRKDFRGDRLLILPSPSISHRWEEWKKILAVPWVDKTVSALRHGLLGEVLITLAAMHNFTFDTSIDDKAIDDTAGRGEMGVFCMNWVIPCTKSPCHVPYAALNSFIYWGLRPEQ